MKVLLVHILRTNGNTSIRNSSSNWEGTKQYGLSRSGLFNEFACGVSTTVLEAVSRLKKLSIILRPEREISVKDDVEGLGSISLLEAFLSLTSS